MKTNLALCSMSFLYAKDGRGELVTYRGGDVVDRLKCRTGSIDTKGHLVNPLPVDNYGLREPSVATTEAGMWIVPGLGRKIRLWRLVNGVWTATRLLIHPDGGAGGSKGCIVILVCDSPASFHLWDSIVAELGEIPLTAGHLVVRKAIA